MTNYYRIVAGTGGSYTKDFLDKGYFGINYDADKTLDGYNKDSYNHFKDKLIKDQPEASSPTKLWKIYAEFKIGDVVLIYVKEDKLFRVGKVASDYEFASKEGTPERYPHRRKISWFASINKNDMPDTLKISLHGPVVIGDVTKHKDIIESLLSGKKWTAEDENNIVAKETEETANTWVSEKTTHHIYVYTLRRYELPIEVPKSETNPIDRTYYKVGCTSVGYKERIKAQIKTAIPEAPIIRRVYKLSDKDEALSKELKDKLIRDYENNIHSVLESAGHDYAKQDSGVEWFITNLDLIDAISEVLGLQCFIKN